jgi:hypothetical protein
VENLEGRSDSVIPSEREGSLEPSTARSLLAALVEMTPFVGALVGMPSFVAALAQDGRIPRMRSE